MSAKGGLKKVGWAARKEVKMYKSKAKPRTFTKVTSTASLIKSKFKDLAAATYACDTTGSLTLIPDLIAQANTEGGRSGDQIILKSVWFKGRFVVSATTTVVDAVAYIVWDKTPNKALPAITAIFNTVSSNSFPLDSAKRRFTVLKKLTFMGTGNSATPATGGEIQDADFYLPLPKDLVVEYDSVVGVTGAIGEIISGGLYLVTMSNVAAGTAACSLIGGFRTRYLNPQ